MYTVILVQWGNSAQYIWLDKMDKVPNNKSSLCFVIVIAIMNLKKFKSTNFENFNAQQSQIFMQMGK